MGGLKSVDRSDDEEEMLYKWTVCVRETEDDEWDVLEDKMHDDKGSARQASAGVRDEYEDRKLMKVTFSSLYDD